MNANIVKLVIKYLPPSYFLKSCPWCFGKKAIPASKLSLISFVGVG